MRWCRTNATCRKSSGIRVWVSPTSRTICAVCWNAGWSVAAAKAASFGIVWRTGGSPISSVMQISYLPRQPTELMPAKAIRTNRRDLLQCPIGAPNLKQPSAHPQRMHPLSRKAVYRLRLCKEHYLRIGAQARDAARATNTATRSTKTKSRAITALLSMCADALSPRGSFLPFLPRRQGDPDQCTNSWASCFLSERRAEV